MNSALYLQILGDLAYARGQFARRHQMAPFHRFFENEAIYLALMRDLMRQPAPPAAPIRSALDQTLTDQWASVLLTELLRNPMGATVVTGTSGAGRPSIWDPVPVVPSREQIRAAVQPLANTAGRICCICQDGLGLEGRPDAVRLRGCNHPFHQSCIEQWFSQSPLCPVCRNDIRVAPSTDTTNVLPAHSHPEPTPPVGPVENVSPSADSTGGTNNVDGTR